MEIQKNNYVAIIDYEMSNLHSVFYACQKLGIKSIITSDNNIILNSKIAILPGVGAYGQAMKKLKSLKLDSTIKKFIDSGKQLIGICLGLQLLFSESEEFGNTKGLNLIEGTIKKIKYNVDSKIRYPIPHVGWNKICKNNSDWKETMLEKNNEFDFMYFVHSYYVDLKDKDKCLTTTNYGEISFCSSINYENIFATQFHPEKSSHQGLKIYEKIKEKFNN